MAKDKIAKPFLTLTSAKAIYGKEGEQPLENLVIGLLFFNIDLNRLQVWNGSSWV